MDRIEEEPVPTREVPAKPEGWTAEQWQSGLALCQFIRRWRRKQAAKLARMEGQCHG